MPSSRFVLNTATETNVSPAWTQQRIEKAIYFPTLGVGMEEALKDDTEAVHAAFEAFNRWLLDDWGFAYKERIYAAPYITLMDRDRGIKELEWALSNDAALRRDAPVVHLQQGRQSLAGRSLLRPLLEDRERRRASPSSTTAATRATASTWPTGARAARSRASALPRCAASRCPTKRPSIWSPR